MFWENNIFYQQANYAYHSAIKDLKSRPIATFTVLFLISISLSIPSICYIAYKNINQTINHALPQITVYLNKMLDDQTTWKVVKKIQLDQEVERVDYYSRKEAVISKFHNSSGICVILDILKENPLPRIAMVIPKSNLQGSGSLNMLRHHIAKIKGINRVRIDDSWFIHLASLATLARRISEMLGLVMIIAVFLIIENRVFQSILFHRDRINIQQLIGATDSFILRPFLYIGAILGFFGAFFTIILTKILLVWISSVMRELNLVAEIRWFSTNIGLNLDECFLLFLICSMSGWMAAWLPISLHLRSLKRN